MTFLALTPIVLAFFLLGAHFLRVGSSGTVLACLLAIGLLFIRRAWVRQAVRVLLWVGAGLWVVIALEIAQVRLALGQPYYRMLIILGVVAASTGLSGLVLNTQRLRQWFSREQSSAKASATAFLVTAGLLAIVQIKVAIPMLLPERILPGGGWIAVVALSAWAALLTELMLDPAGQPRWRRRAWALFSLVFFAQLALGLAGIEQFLLTGELHLPVPALILAGPIFRGQGLLMPILFGATVLIVGPAWCSHLCYVGALDSALASRGKRPSPLPSWARRARIAIAAIVIAAALALRLLGASTGLAFALALGFGLLGIAVTVLLSRRAGTMVHCVVYCPIGLAANLLGKISPFRIRIGPDCTRCGSCTKVCRYDALNEQDLNKKRPALTCSLCGDCIGACPDTQITYRFANLSPHTARTVFVVLAASLHAAFLAVARI